jgi:magnesium-transporting ATPase (P-type)
MPDEDPTGLSPKALQQRKPSLALMALFAILDPPREEAIAAAKVAQEAGVAVKVRQGCLSAS